MLARLQKTDEKEKADNDDERETKTRETHKAKGIAKVFWRCVLRR